MSAAALPAQAAPALRLSGISKRFGPLVANDDISLTLAAGEVLALLGENGAGKSTLVSILFGHYLADAGRIEVNGKALPPGQPRAALAAGIGMVHQHFTLADNLSVLDNVMLGTESLWRWRSARAQARRRLQALAQQFGLEVDADARVGDLSVGERQRVEILKALLRGARILILDEPTAVLTPQESESLFATLAQMVGQGLSLIFISHKLDEVLRVSHRIAVLRHGRLVAEMPSAGASKAQLAQAMIGQALEAVSAAQAPRAEDAGALVTQTVPQTVPILALDRASVRGKSGKAALDGVTLQVHGGEIVAIAGVAGNGQAALASVLFGELALDGGSLLLQGRPLAGGQAAFVAAGVARVPEDRQHVGVVGEMAVWENAVLEHYRSPAFARAGWLRRSAAMAWTQQLVQRFDVRGAQLQSRNAMAARTQRLSGGNMQKLILARVLSPLPGSAQTSPPPLIVAHQPTWGLDVGALAFVHAQLRAAAAAGSAVLVISEDLDEVLALADRVAVMHRGRLSTALPGSAWTVRSLGLAMAGAAAQASKGERQGQHAAA